MTDAGTNLNKTKTIIISACAVLQRARQQAAAGRRPGTYAADADCFVLLQDATKYFCRCVSELYGEPAGKRWSPVFPELLLSHPEKCAETLALVERKDFQELSYFQFVAA